MPSAPEISSWVRSEEFWVKHLFSKVLDLLEAAAAAVMLGETAYTVTGNSGLKMLWRKMMRMKKTMKRKRRMMRTRMWVQTAAVCVLSFR